MSDLKEKDNACMPRTSADQAINVAKWDKTSPWLALVKALPNTGTWSECREPPAKEEKRTKK